MAGLLALLGLLFKGGANIASAIDESKKEVAGEYTDGSTRYVNRTHQYFAENGEKVVPSFTKVNGKIYGTEVGARTGRTYYNEYDQQNKAMWKYDEEAKERSRLYGDITYLWWNPHFQKRVPTEFSTEKPLAAIGEYPHNGIKEYRKFYLTNKCEDYKTPDLFDDGVIIDREEYELLKREGLNEAGIETYCRITGVYNEENRKDYRKYCMVKGRIDEYEKYLTKYDLRNPHSATKKENKSDLKFAQFRKAKSDYDMSIAKKDPRKTDGFMLNAIDELKVVASAEGKTISQVLNEWKEWMKTQ